MEFTRKKKRGQNGKTRKTWYAPNGYRIVWRKAAGGVEIPPRFQATVKTMVPANETFEMWDFVDIGKHCYKTMKAAQDAAEKHFRNWTQALEVKSARALKEIFGRIPFGFPTWVQRKLNRQILLVLTDNAPAAEEECEESPKVSTTSSAAIDAPLAEATTPDPAAPATEKVGTTSPAKRRTRLKATDTAEPPPVLPATEPAKAPGKRAAKPTAPTSITSKRKSVRAKRSAKSAKKLSTNSRKKKSTPSAS